MGLDAFYQSTPPGCELLRRSIADPAYGEFLTSKYRFKPERPHPMWEGEDVEFLQELDRLLNANPGLHARNYSLDRAWDMLEYVISPVRRSGIFDQPDLGRIAVNGEKELAPHLFCGQGVPIRLSSPDTVKKILTYLMQTDFRSNFNLSQMLQGGVYKCADDWTDETFWPYIETYLRDFTGFYRQAAIHNEAVLVWID